MSEYLVTKRFKLKTVCGDVNLPYGTVCTAKDGVIYCDQGALCAVGSENFKAYFTLNNDGNAKTRRKLINDILKSLSKNGQAKEKYDKKWRAIWEDPICMSMRKEGVGDYFFWGDKFYAADIPTLEYIFQLINKG